MCTDHTFCDSYDVLIKHTWRLTAEDDAVPSLPSAVTSSADSPPCHVGKWVHLNRLGAWVVRGEPAALTKDAAEEVSKRPDAPKAHSAAAYCRPACQNQTTGTHIDIGCRPAPSVTHDDKPWPVHKASQAG